MSIVSTLFTHDISRQEMLAARFWIMAESRPDS
ncbi:MAG: hypothetical protein ACI91J_000671 [Yoonia sp.]